MKIETAKKAGFCVGVKRALEMTREEAQKAGDSSVYTLGPLVHNPQLIKKLEEERIYAIDELESETDRRLIIRSHGISPDVRREAEKAGYRITDATCPLVDKIHKIALQLHNEGYPLIIIGHREHPEIVGIVGEVGGDCAVIENREEVSQIPYMPRLGVVVQTTFLLSEFLEITSRLIEKAREVRIFNTICGATAERQSAARDLAQRADVMIIVGGKNSSNTKRLHELCLNINKNSRHIESESELQKEWFDGVERVGITAGASTPDYIIAKVIERIQKFDS